MWNEFRGTRTTSAIQFPPTKLTHSFSRRNWGHSRFQTFTKHDGKLSSHNSRSGGHKNSSSFQSQLCIWSSITVRGRCKKRSGTRKRIVDWPIPLSKHLQHSLSEFVSSEPILGQKAVASKLKKQQEQQEQKRTMMNTKKKKIIKPRQRRNERDLNLPCDSALDGCWRSNNVHR